MKDIQTILLALEFGKTEDRLLREAVAVARLFDAAVIPVHAVSLHYDYPAFPIEQLHATHERIDEHLADVQKHLQEEGVKCIEFVRRDGTAKSVILDVASEKDVDLIIIGARKKNAISRIFGTTAEEMIRTAIQPVWIVHPEEPLGASDSVLCAVDCSEHSAHTLQAAIDLVRATKADLHILHVFQTPVYYPMQTFSGDPADDIFPVLLPGAYATLAEVSEEAKKSEQLKLDAFMTRFDLSDVEYVADVREGFPPQEIIKTVEEENIGLMVMGTIDSSDLFFHFRRGTAEQLLRKLRCSIVTIKHHI